MPFADFSVEKLIARTPMAVQYLWIVDVQIPGGNNARDLTLLAVSASIPGVTNEEIEVPYMNSRFWIAGRRNWETIDVTFREDESGLVTRNFYNWHNLIYNVEGYGEGGIPKEYKSRMDISLLTRKGEEIAQWLLYGVWPQTQPNTDLGYANEEVLEVAVTFRYDYWTRNPVSEKGLVETGLPGGGSLEIPGVPRPSIEAGVSIST